MAKPAKADSKKPQSSATPAGPAPAAPPRLEPDQIARALAGLPEWSDMAGTIQRTYAFADFVNSLAFVRSAGAEAERVQHHPDILIRYNKVTMTLSTHDSGGITQRDIDMAHALDRLSGQT